MLVLNSGTQNLDVILHKGYFVDLSESQTLTEYAAALYPDMAAAARQGDRLACIPFGVEATPLAWNHTLGNQLGTEQPATFEELCAFISHWNDNMADSHPHLRPVFWQNIKPMLMSLALQLHEDTSRLQGEPLTLNHPRLITMLSLIDGVADGDIPPPAPMDELSPEDNTLTTQVWGLVLSSFNDAASDGNAGRPFALAADEVSPAVLGLELRVMLVNLASSQPELALHYLEAYVDNLPPEVQALLMPGMNDPIQNPGWPGMEKMSQGYIDHVRNSLENMEGDAQRREREGDLELALQMHADMRPPCAGRQRLRASAATGS